MPTITSIRIENHPKIGDLEIELGEGCRHLILTGPNGSGKSMVLKALVQEIASGGRRSRVRARSPKHESEPFGVVVGLDVGPLRGSGLLGLGAYLPSKRSFKPQRTNRPPVPRRTEYHSMLQSANTDFYEWFKHQHLQALLARVAGAEAEALALSEWIDWFTEKLGTALGLPGLELRFDRQSYEVSFVEEGGQPYWIEDLADGHAAILGVVSEILMRAKPEEWRSSPRRIGGVVVIDELETHLHPELEEQILPFLTGTFPGLQFVVATHSPIITASVPDAYVFDLRLKEGTPSSEFVGKKYGDLMTSHFGIETDFDLATTRLLHEFSRLVESGQDPARCSELLNRLRGVDHPLVLAELIKQMKQESVP